MTRKIVANDMVQHLWANQSQDEARSHNGNHSFTGRTLYSYSTPIAYITEGAKGQRVALVTSRRYSVTTSGKHMPGRALGYTYHSVPEIYPTEVRSGWSSGLYVPKAKDWAELHAINVVALKARYDNAVAAMRRRRTEPSYDILGTLDRYARDLRLYCEDFGLDCPALDTAADAEAIKAHRAARDTPEAKAKREKATAKREALEAEKRRLAGLEAEERLAAWLEGGPVPTYRLPRTEYPMLRLKGQTVETTWGATVPLEAAKQAFRMAKLCRAKGQGWQANGHTLPVGSFMVQHIGPDGTIRAGCHLIPYVEQERFALAIGAADLPAEDTTQAR